ncbi:hypothetical protein BU17DRAFT_42049 [Hysterangium stoloniferum]|nr:hypothetical protein BU17DRAFT_42049 [Hysterangium stoloniferum]
MLPFALTILALISPSRAENLTTPENIASAYSLSASTSLPFPTAKLSSSDADDYIIAQWSLNKNHIQNQPANLAFVDDPFPDASSSNDTAVLRTTYPKGTFSDNDGGAQFLSLFNRSQPQTMLVSYEVAFEDGFDWVKGGKLPGLRGGPNTTACEGGNLSNGTNCFSTRMMWRAGGVGEVYGYLPPSNNYLCSGSSTVGFVICDSDFGTSIGRSSFTFVTGAWNKISMLVQLNDPVDLANGNIILYYNDVIAIQESGLQLRSDENVLATGFFFSTFFGGNDKSWAPTSDQHAFFRNFQIWASNATSNSTGVKVSSATSLLTNGTGVWWMQFIGIAIAVCTSVGAHIL